MKLWKKAALSAVLAAGLCGSVAWAQNSDTQGNVPYPPHHRGMMAGPMMGVQGQEGVAYRLAHLHQKLAITPQQEEGWRSFSQKMLDHHKKQGDAFRGDWEKLRNATLPERLDLMEANRKELDTVTAEFHKNIKDFYATLSPEQKVIMDNSWGPMKGMGSQGHYRGPKGGHGPHDGYHRGGPNGGGRGWR